MTAPSLDRLVDDPESTLDELRRYTKSNGGRTRLHWRRNFGAVGRDEAVVICATSPDDMRALLAVAERLWGPNSNDGKREN